MYICSGDLILFFFSFGLILYIMFIIFREITYIYSALSVLAARHSSIIYFFFLQQFIIVEHFSHHIYTFGWNAPPQSLSYGCHFSEHLGDHIFIKA